MTHLDISFGSLQDKKTSKVRPDINMIPLPNMISYCQKLDGLRKNCLYVQSTKADERKGVVHHGMSTDSDLQVLEHKMNKEMEDMEIHLISWTNSSIRYQLSQILEKRLGQITNFMEDGVETAVDEVQATIEVMFAQ